MTDENENETKAEIVATGGGVMEIKNSEDSMIERAAYMAKFFKMALGKLAECTSASNWTDQAGKPFLDHNGASRIARVLGISIVDPKVEKSIIEDNSGNKVLSFSIIGGAYIVLPDGTQQFTPVCGTCDFQDKFYKNRISFNETDIKKKAYANYIGRCIREFLGIGGMTWEELAAHGISRDGVAKVDFKSGKNSGKSADGDDARSKLREMILSDANENAPAACDILEKLTAFVNKDGKEIPGKRNVADLTDKAAGFAWGNYQDGGAKHGEYLRIVEETLKEYGKKAE